MTLKEKYSFVTQASFVRLQMTLLNFSVCGLMHFYISNMVSSFILKCLILE